jgi:hypothetical protein
MQVGAKICGAISDTSVNKPAKRMARGDPGSSKLDIEHNFMCVKLIREAVNVPKA